MPALLDTDVAIELLRGNEFTRDCLAQCEEEIFISTITAAELYYGAYHSRRVKENVAIVESFLNQFPRLSLTDESARVFGGTKEKLQAAKTPVDGFDLMIASVALENGCKVITGNTRHFAKVPGLILEDWTKK